MEETTAPIIRKTRARSKKKSYERREFNPEQPNKKPFYDTKRKVWVVPTPRSGMPASGMKASGIPAGNNTIGLPRKYDHLFRPPEDTKTQNELGDELLQWAMLPESRHVGLFAIFKGINPYKFRKLAESNEHFASCLDMAEYIIGSRLIDGAQSRKEDGNVNMKLLPMYNRDYKQLIDDQKKSEAARIATQVNVITEAIPDSNLVPKLPKREE